MNPRVTSAEYIGDHKLLLTFVNSEVKQFDLGPYLIYPIYEPLNDEAFCKNLKVEDGVILWDDEIDLDPDIAYLESKKISPFAQV